MMYQLLILCIKTYIKLSHEWHVFIKKKDLFLVNNYKLKTGQCTNYAGNLTSTDIVAHWRFVYYRY